MGRPTVGRQADHLPSEILQNEAVRVCRFVRATTAQGPARDFNSTRMGCDCRSA